MALTRQVFAVANTEAFAEALRTALDNTHLFDSVTRSDLVVTGIKREQDIISIHLDAYNGGNLMIVNNATGTRLITMPLMYYGDLASYASITTDGSFVYFILTNSTTMSGAQDITRSVITGVFGTENGEIGFTHSICQNTTNSVYPPEYTCLCSSTAVVNDTGTAFFIPKTYNYNCIVSYPLTTLTTDGGMDTLKGVYGIMGGPTLFTLSRSAQGVNPSTIIIEGKQYLTDGVILIELND